MEGFDIFVMNYEGIESKGVEQYFSNREGRYSAFVGICARIKKEIRNDQIQGGMVGQFNPSITQRLNGLTEKTDVTTNGKEINEIKVNIVRDGTVYK
jgi:DNA polymerase II small subunit/DNA polymerase delta subunit B